MKSLLFPLVNHSAMVYSMIKQLGEAIPRYIQSWDRFYMVVLGSLEKHAKKGNFIDAIKNTNGKEKELLISDAIQTINQQIIQDTARYDQYNYYNHTHHTFGKFRTTQRFSVFIISKACMQLCFSLRCKYIFYG